MNRDYAELCERLWRRWLAGEIEPSTEVQRHFDVDAVPEPYLIFGDTSDPLVVVTTNPGATMEHQRRDTILRGDSPVTPRMRYSDVAREMARWYQDHLSGAAATRIRAQIDLATACGFTGVVQVECLPWHSDRLPKPRAIQVMRSDEESSAYVRALEAQIEGAPTIALSAVHPGTDFLAPSLRLSDWLSWQMSFLNIDVHEAVRIPLVTKDGRPTSMALCQKSGGSPRALVLMMGGNHFPSRSNLTPLVEWLSPRRTEPLHGGSLLSIGWDVGGWQGSKQAVAAAWLDAGSRDPEWLGVSQGFPFKTGATVDLEALLEPLRKTQVLEKVDQADAVIVAIDAPLAFPDTFRDHLSNEASTPVVPARHIDSRLAYRDCERQIEHDFHSPLSAPFDKLGNNATLAMTLCRNLRATRFGIAPFDPETSDRQAIEVYPALVKNSSSGSRAIPRLHDLLPGELGPGTDPYDAAVCAVLGLLFADAGRLGFPELAGPPDDYYRASTEGWIYHLPRDFVQAAS